MPPLDHRIDARRAAPPLDRLRTGAALLLALAIVGCEGTRFTETGPSVATVISGVSTPEGAAGVLTAGRLPSSADGAAFAVTAPPAAVVGGTALYTLSSNTPFQQALVTIEGFENYYRLDLPGPVKSAEILVTFKQEQLYFNYNVQFNGVEAGGAQGRAAFAHTRLVSVGTGDVQVSVFFDDTSDVDLHVFDPKGSHIFYGAKRAPSGGTLDLDANAGCGTDRPVVNNENVTFPTGTAPRGTYRVHLDYFSACGTSPTRYVVTVGVKGQPVRVYSGTFVGTSADEENDMREIVTFTY